MASQKPILISGAGLASLLLGRSLLRSKIPFLIFERDASISFRAQGYRLRLSNEGLAAVESVLGPEGFRKFYDKCGKTGGAGFAAVNPLTGETSGPPPSQQQQQKHEQQQRQRQQQQNQPQPDGSQGSLASREGKVVGIARGEMRKLFLEGSEAYIHWSHHVTGYELTPTGGVRAIFFDGTKSQEGSMLIGGEGIKSRVAKQLSGGKLKVYDLGGRGIHGEAPATAFKQLGEGVFMMSDSTSDPDGKVNMITNVRPGAVDNPNEVLGWTMIGAPGVIKAPNDNYTIIGKPVADMAKKLTKSWHPRVKALVDNMDESEAAFWKITCSSPDGVPQWPNEPRVTVIGDAAHSMTPAGGLGANTAMRDSALLGRLLGEAGGFKEGLTEAYEREMREYGSEAVKSSFGQMKGMLGVEINEETPTIE